MSGNRSPSRPKVGRAYQLAHQRFGKATVKVLEVWGRGAGNVWARVLVLKGTLEGMTDIWEPGSEKTVRVSQGVWALVEAES